MITTRRSYEGADSIKNRSGLDLLERPTEEKVASNEESRQIRQRNLNLILNYDKADSVQVKEAENIVDSVCGQVNETAYLDSDLNPTSTTMQFGKDGDLDQETVKNELSKSQSVYNATESKVNVKGRILLALYSLAVMVVLALIIINTGVLTTLKNANAQKEADLASLQQEYYEQQVNIENISSNEYIGGKAVEMGMSK